MHKLATGIWQQTEYALRLLQQPSLSSRCTYHYQQLHWLPVKWRIQF